MKEKIEKYFRLYQQLRVLFFFDPEGENMLDIDLIELEGVRVVKFANNAFTLKHNLTENGRMKRFSFTSTNLTHALRRSTKTFHCWGC